MESNLGNEILLTVEMTGSRRRTRNEGDEGGSRNPSWHPERGMNHPLRGRNHPSFRLLAEKTFNLKRNHMKMLNPLIHPIFVFICINWFLVFTPFLSFVSFLSSLIWSLFLSFLLLFNPGPFGPPLAGLF